MNNHASKSGSTEARDDLPDLLASARVAWPSLAVDPGRFFAYVEARAIMLSTLSPQLAADLYLAFACFANLPNAIETFTKQYGATVESAARNFDGSVTFVDEVKQRLAESLFVGSTTREPRIGQYRAVGPLAGWVRTAAKRIALRLVSAERGERFVQDEVLVRELAAVCDQELALSKAHCAAAFREALNAAISNLEPRERMLMKLHLVAGLTTVRIGKAYHLSQSSVSRHIQRATRRVLDEVKDRLRDTLGVQSKDVESLFELVQSQIDLTFSVADALPDAEDN
jgi:RNA polymerase sigma-70 factor